MSNDPSNRRTRWFDQVYGGRASGQPSIPSPYEAQAMVDQAVYNLGIDPQSAVDAEGWRHLQFGTAHGLINVVEWEPGIHFLVVWSPILRAPEDSRLCARLFETLLRLSHRATGMARFSLKDDKVVLSFVRPIHGLDLDEVMDAIRTVMVAADALDGELQAAFEVAMPQIQVDDETWKGILDVLRLCDAYTQMVFRQIMERWAKRGGVVDAGGSNIGLRSRSSERKTVAALIAYASAGPLVTVGWDSLSRVWGVRPKDADRFQKAVPRPSRFKMTESSAHLPVDESFTEAMIDQLLDALAFLDQALQRAIPPRSEPLPDLEDAWGLKIKVGGATQRNIHAMLTACPPTVQSGYARLIQGWHDAEQKLYTNNPGRVYLRLAVDTHTFALCTLCGPQKKRNPRIELFYPLSYYFEAYLDARRRYEQNVVRVPGFKVDNSGARIYVEEGFTTRDAEKLLRVLVRLAEDVRAGS